MSDFTEIHLSFICLVDVSSYNAEYRMDIDYSPTGREFVTGSYDRTVRSPINYVLFLLYINLAYRFAAIAPHKCLVRF